MFVSYSHDPADAHYVSRLVEFLHNQGVPAWYDRELASGERWEEMLRERIDECAGLVVVMSPVAQDSVWVAREVEQARQSNRPVHPLLLAGRVFPSLAHLQYESVIDDAMPSPRFVRRLTELVTAPTRSGRWARLAGRGFPLRNRYFVGRDDLLARLTTGLLWGPAVVVHGLRGLGGVGKTQVAAEYAYRHADAYDLVGWIDAEQAYLIPDQLAALAQALDIPVADGTPAATVANDVIHKLGSTDLRWLLIFDNAVSPPDVAPFVPRGGQGHVVVTSRQGGWAALGPTIDVDVLPRAQALALLRRRVTVADDAAADGICELLGDLPLAVEQAGAYLAETHLSAAEYLTLLRTRAAELLSRGHVAGTAHTVTGVWDVSRQRLAAANPAAAVLLDLCAYLGPEPIPLDMFATHPEVLPTPLDEVAADPIRFADTVGALLGFSLARSSGDRISISVHRLIATVLRTQTAHDPRAGPEQLRTAIAVLAAAAPTEPDNNVAGWPTWSRLLPHVRAAMAHLPDRHTDAVALELGDRAAMYMLGQGQVGPATVLFEQVLDDRMRVLGEDHPDTLASRHNLAVAFEAAGHINEAIGLKEQVLAAYRRVLGEDHLDTLRTRNNLAFAYERAGRLDEAVTMHELALADHRRVLGDDHPDTLTSRNNLAVTYLRAGRVDEAIILFDHVITDSQRLIGEDNPATLRSRNNLAYAYRTAGRIDEAIEMFKQVVIDRGRVLGEDHPDTLRSRNNLAATNRAAGRFDEAVAQLEHVVTDYRRVLGDDHPDTLRSRDDLALAYRSAGRATEAITLYENVLTDSKRILGPDHPITVAAQENLAAIRPETPST